MVSEKFRNISSDDQPWFTEQLKVLEKRRQKKFTKHRRSNKYKTIQKCLNNVHLIPCLSAVERDPLPLTLSV